jgi:hypothetical protein
MEQRVKTVIRAKPGLNFRSLYVNSFSYIYLVIVAVRTPYIEYYLAVENKVF